MERNKIDDLEYLANLGFEKVKTSQSDIVEIKKEIRNRSFRTGNSFGINLVTLIVGAFIGIVVFYVMQDRSGAKVEAKAKVEVGK